MQGINAWAIVVAALAAFVASSAWYVAFAQQRAQFSSGGMTLDARPQPTKMLAEVIRNVILAIVLAYLVAHLGVENWLGALGFGLLAWVGFPLILLSGSVMWENVPWKLAALHAGDWLVKLLLIALIVGVWR